MIPAATLPLLIGLMLPGGAGTDSAQTAQAATPVFTPVAGTYTSAQTVTITDATPGTTIYYTTDGSTPTVGAGVTSIASLPHLNAALRGSTQVPIYIACYGSSVSIGATLANANTQAACAVLKTQLQQKMDQGNVYKWHADNQSVNGSTAWQFAASYAATGQALSGVTVASGGTDYCVGDWETVNQGTSPSGSVIVTATDGSSGKSCGAITAVTLSTFLNNITDADVTTPSTGGYTVASGVPLLNGPTSVLSVAEQTGVGTGATVNITSVGVTPTVCAFFFGMTDFQPPEYNSGERLPGFESSLASAIQQCGEANADVIIFTTPHYSVANDASEILYGLPVGEAQTYPTYVAPPVTADLMQPPYPGTTGNQSVITGDLLNNGGPDVSLDYRFLTGNQAMRTLCAQPGCVLLDAESYWVQGIQGYIMTLGSQSAAENYLFDPGEVVHPNLYGQQVSYGAAIDDFGTSVYMGPIIMPAGPITVPETETLRAVAVASGYANSAVASAVYAIGSPAATPTFSVPAGTYSAAQTVTISDTTPGATIYYTTNGSTPTVNSTVYKGAITVSVTETIRAIATATGYSQSAVATAAYTITPTFTIAGTAVSVAPGATTGNTSTITVTPANGFTGAVTLSCAITPAATNDPATCSLSPASVTISGSSAQTSALTVYTTGATALNRPMRLFWPSAGGVVLALVFFFGIPAKRRSWLAMLGLLVLIFAAASIGCGGGGGSGSGGGGGSSNPGTTPGSYTITVTGTSGTTTATGSVFLTVQ